MADISMYKRRDTTTFVAESSVGLKFMQQTFVMTGGDFHTVPSDSEEEIIEIIQIAGLTLDY